MVVLHAAGARASGKPAGADLEKIENSARQALGETRCLLGVLRDPDEQAGLAPAIAAAVRAAHARTHERPENLIAAGIAAGEWPEGTDPALAARLFTAGLYGLMAQWHLAPGSCSWDAAAAVLAGDPAPGEGDGASSPGRSP